MKRDFTRRILSQSHGAHKTPVRIGRVLRRDDGVVAAGVAFGETVEGAGQCRAGPFKRAEELTGDAVESNRPLDFAPARP